MCIFKMLTMKCGIQKRPQNGENFSTPPPLPPPPPYPPPRPRRGVWGLELNCRPPHGAIPSHPIPHPLPSRPMPRDPASSPGLELAFRNFWEAKRTSVSRDTAHLWTGRDLALSVAGCAFQGSLCDSYAYGVEEIFFRGLTGTSDMLKAALFAHELAHNADADHCVDVGCDGHVMETTISATTDFHPQSVAAVKAFLSTKSCLQSDGVPCSSRVAGRFHVHEPPNEAAALGQCAAAVKARAMKNTVQVIPLLVTTGGLRHSVQTIGGHCARPNRGWTHTSP